MANKNEGLKAFIEELLKTKFTKEKLLKGLQDDELLEMLDAMQDEVLEEHRTESNVEDEVCPSLDEGEVVMDVNDEELEALIKELDAAGIPYTVLNKEEYEQTQEEDKENEEKIVDLFYMIENDDEPSVKLTEEELEYIEEIAEEIEPIHLGRVLPCVVNGEDRYLTDGLNCNFVDIPLLGVTLLSPVNIKIDVLYIDPNAESLDEIKLLVTMPWGENVGYGCETTIGILRKVGLLELFATFDLELDLTALAFRGIIKKADVEEFEELIKLSEGVNNNGVLN